jgi:hypothetical protein
MPTTEPIISVYSALAPVDAKTVLSLPLDGRVVSDNGGGDCFIVGGHFTLSRDNGSIL